jgi:hypothetical protein
MTSYFAVPPDLCIISNLSPANYVACYLLCASFLLGILVGPEDIGNMFLIYVGCFSSGYMALYPGRYNTS